MSKMRKGFTLASKIAFYCTFVLYGLTSAGGPVALANDSIINGYLGIQTEFGSGSGSTYFDTDYSNMAEVKDSSLNMVEETEKEGAVLLKNDNSALPLSSGDKVSMYGFASHYSVLTGQGSSGNSEPSDAINLYTGLEDAGLEMNESLDNYYASNSISTYVNGTSTSFVAGTTQESQYVVKDASWSQLPNAKSNDAKAAVMVLARTAGEAEDYSMDITMDGGDQSRVIIAKNDYNNPSGSVGDALELSANEKSVLQGLKTLKDNGTIDKIVVLMNSSSPLECNFLSDANYGIDACMWVGTLGTNGADAVGKLMTGEYNPSGKTSDTFWQASKYNPVYFNFGSQEYTNADSALVNGYFSTMGYQNHKYYSVYQEGIYNGYKYTETRYEDEVMGRANAGSFDYSDAVAYPFGYGLSYSNFTYSNFSVTKNSGNDTYTFKVDVTNNSSVDGKEVIEIYLQKPYTEKDIENGIETASVELVGFAKVDVKAGQTVTSSTNVERKYFASYDANVEKTYVIGSTNTADKYLLTAAPDSHTAINNIIQYKSGQGASINSSKIYSLNGNTGNSSLVYSEYIPYDASEYSTNAFIEEQNQNFTADYEGEEANYGVSKITNQFDDVDFKKAGIFSETDTDQPYLSRNNWSETYGHQIQLTANSALKNAQKATAATPDNIDYPTYNAKNFYEGEDTIDEMKLIYLRGADYDDPAWNSLLDCMSFEEVCNLLQTGLRCTNSVESISAPSTSEQNGSLAPNHPRTYSGLPIQSGFGGFSELLDPENQSQTPNIFACNGIVASTYNTDLIQRLGEQIGEEGLWAGYNGIYGLGVNLHRGAYCGRSFEYYSEDGFLTGVAAGYEAVGLNKKGVFVLMKHAILNDQETHRAGLNVWANEQTIRENYARAIEVAVEIDNANISNPTLGVMTGMNRLGATWTGGQGFCNTVLKAEFGMRGYIISDYNSSRPYMGTVQGVLNGNDLPDGNPAGNFSSGLDYDGNDLILKDYAANYGKLAWAMRDSAKHILYTIVNSNAMNGIDGDSYFKVITPLWETLVPVANRVTMTLFIWSAGLYGIFSLIRISENVIEESKSKKDN